MISRFAIAAIFGALTLPAHADSHQMMPSVTIDGVRIDGAMVTIPNITAAEDGFVVIHTMLDGAPVVPASIGHAAVMMGENTDVTVEVNFPFAEGESYMVMLHVDSNDNGMYEFAAGMTDVDTPVMQDGGIVAQVFTASSENMDAMAAADDLTPIVVTEGIMIDGDTAMVPSVTAAADGYLVIHAMSDGAPVVPASIGHVMVPQGVHTDLPVTINYPFVSGESYMAMLHVETNGNDTYDFAAGMTDVDTPVMQDGGIVASVFTVD